MTSSATDDIQCTRAGHTITEDTSLRDFIKFLLDRAETPHSDDDLDRLCGPFGFCPNVKKLRTMISAPSWASTPVDAYIRVLVEKELIGNMTEVSTLKEIDDYFRSEKLAFHVTQPVGDETIFAKNDEDFIESFSQLFCSYRGDNLPEVHFTKREERCIRVLGKSLYLASKRVHAHISNILVGLKGVGKTTLIQRLCRIAAQLSDKLFITYYDVSRGGEHYLPLDILHAALRRRGVTTEFPTISLLLDFLRNSQYFFLTVFDEAEGYYALQTAPESERKQSRKAITQLAQLGGELGSTVILCGSSSKLVDLALKRTSTELASLLQADYIHYSSLNHQKYSPLVLPTVELGDAKDYLKTAGIIVNREQLKNRWLDSGGSLRSLIRGDLYPSGLFYWQGGPLELILRWLFSEQDEGCDEWSLKRIPIDSFMHQHALWVVDSYDFKPSIIYDYIDEQLLSCSWSESSVISHIGFATPTQWCNIRAQEKKGGLSAMRTARRTVRQGGKRTAANNNDDESESSGTPSKKQKHKRR